jgi:hypothetical protein
MDKVKKPSNSVCHAPSSEPFRLGNASAANTVSQDTDILTETDCSFAVFTAMTMKNSVFWDVTSCEIRASHIRVTRIGELGTTLAVTRNRLTLRFTECCNPDDGSGTVLRNFGPYKIHTK